jgi:acetylglutamate kinase
VRFIARDAIRRQLDNDNIVLLSNLGFTAAGEVLNCNTFDVGLHAAVELGADKLICLHLGDVKGGCKGHACATGPAESRRFECGCVPLTWVVF